MTTVAGRSERTRKLAVAAGLDLLADVDEVCATADAVLSIVPPEEAVSAAKLIRRRARLWADLNPLAPAKVRTLGCDVDGSISGPPPAEGSETRIYLSGPRVQELVELLRFGPEVQTIVVGDELGSASAVKMSTASVYKGTNALLAQALLSADANGVLEHVLADLGRLAGDPGYRLASVASKSERFVGEMHEIAATQEAADLPRELFEAMAEVYRWMSDTTAAQANPEDLQPGVALDPVLAALRQLRT